MQRHRALALIGAAGLGALAVVLLFTGDEASLPGVGLAVDLPAEPPSSPGRLHHPVAPTLEPAAEENRRRKRLREAVRARQASRPTTLAQLVRAPGWISFLETWLQLPAAPDDGTRLMRIQQGLARATQPVVRQNLIFLAALALEAELVEPWLQTVRRGGDAGDAEDALLALAFGGEPTARAEFLQLAWNPAQAPVRRLVDWHDDHEDIGKRADTRAREILRSYRAIEAWSRRPYFKMTSFLATRRFDREEGFGAMLGWTPREAAGARDDIDLLRAWLERYPGHPGSDDMALLIAERYARLGERMATARWASKAATLPDQDVSFAAATWLVSQCEIHLRPEEILALSEDEGLSTPNRRYYQYAYVRRLAADRGLEDALHALQDRAAREPDSELGAAWANRWSAEVTKGVDSGVAPLPADDPLRRREAVQAPWPPRRPPGQSDWLLTPGIRTGRWGDEAQRLRPWPEVVVLDREKLLRQVRAWVTLAELARRAERARGTARADLLYQQAAVYYHDRDVLFPVYGAHTGNFRGHLGGDERFEERTFAYLRALRIFERLESRHPDYPALDKVIFSQGMLWKRLVEYRPHWMWNPGVDYEHWGDRRRASMRHVATTFERLVRLFPDSPLSGDARAAAAWWRRARPAAFEAR